MRTITVSLVAPRYKCAAHLREIHREKITGLISNVKLTRIGILTWHLEYKVEVK